MTILDWRLRDYNGRYVFASTLPAPEPEPQEPNEQLPGLPFDEDLKATARKQSWEWVAITHHATVTDVIASATIRWPDGSAGVYTLLSINAPLHQWDSFSVTHADSGKTITRTVKARNADGLATGFTTTVS